MSFQRPSLGRRRHCQFSERKEYGHQRHDGKGKDPAPEVMQVRSSCWDERMSALPTVLLSQAQGSTHNMRLVRGEGEG